MNYSKKDIITACTIATFILTFAVVFTVFFTPLYGFCIDVLEIDVYSGLSKEVLMENYQSLIDYQAFFYNGPLYLPDFEMSVNGRIHFEEVKNIFVVIQYLCIISFVTSIGLLYSHYKDNRRFIYLRLARTITIAFPTIVGIVCMIDFDSAFVLFHRIFFRNDYWIFDPQTDPIITVLPQDFFMYCFLIIVSIIIILALVCHIIYKRNEKKLLK